MSSGNSCKRTTQKRMRRRYFKMTVFVNDTFTDTNGVLLQNHTPAVGEIWVKRDTLPNADIQSNKAKSTSATIVGGLYTNAVSPSVGYDITCVLDVATPVSSDGMYLYGRFADINNFYQVRVMHGTSWTLHKKVAGVLTLLHSAAPVAHTYPCTLKFEIRDATKKVYKDGVEVLTSADNVLTSAGRPGLRIYTTRSTVDDFLADDQVAPPAENAFMQPMRTWWPK